MSHFKHYLFTALGFVTLVGVLVLLDATTGSSAPPASTSNVNVVNTTGNPVPTIAQGTTSVSGNVGINGSVNLAPGTNVGINGSVQLAPGTSVGVDSDIDNPVFVRSVDNRQIFQYEADFDIPDGEIGKTEGLHLPEGKRLVIEHVSATGIVPGGQKLQFVLTTVAAGVQVTYYLAPQALGFGDLSSIEVFNANQAMHIYAVGDPANTSIVFSVGRFVNTGHASASISISGYLVDCPETGTRPCVP
jgi:hypothetical protein